MSDAFVVAAQDADVVVLGIGEHSGDQHVDRQLLAGFLRSTGASGVRVGIRVGDADLRFAAHGLDGRSPARAMAPEGRFRVASVTKTFTSAPSHDAVTAVHANIQEISTIDLVAQVSDILEGELDGR